MTIRKNLPAGTDINQRAKAIVDIITDMTTDKKPVKKTNRKKKKARK